MVSKGEQFRGRDSVKKTRLPYSPVQDPVTRASRAVVDAVPNRNKMMEALRNVKIAKRGIR